MYDAVTIILTRDRMGKDWDDRRVKTMIDPVPFTRHDIEYCGRVNNLFVAKKQGELCICGSLTKLCFGYNDQNAGITEMRSAAKRLCDLFQLPVDRGYIRRVEIGFNLALKQKVENYLLLLKYARGYRELRTYPTGRAFSQKELSMVFYNKRIEAERNGRLTEMGANVLRYELRLKYPSRLLGSPGGIFLSDLLETKVADGLIGFWVKEYFRIVKNRQAILPPTITCSKDFSDFIWLVGARALGGEPALHEMVDSFRFPSSNNESKVRHDMRASIGRMHSNVALITGNDLEAELDAAVMQTALLHSP